MLFFLLLVQLTLSLKDDLLRCLIITAACRKHGSVCEHSNKLRAVNQHTVQVVKSVVDTTWKSCKAAKAVVQDNR